jgi:hypothetical protein
MRVYQFRHVGTATAAKFNGTDLHLNPVLLAISHRVVAKDRNYSGKRFKVNPILSLNIRKWMVLGKYRTRPVYLPLYQ